VLGLGLEFVQWASFDGPDFDRELFKSCLDCAVREFRLL